MLEKYFTPDEIDTLIEVGPEAIKEKFVKHRHKSCDCVDCLTNNEKLFMHLEHPFYNKANRYREQERIGQIVKGSEKYKEPFNPASWSSKQLLQHAMQENIDQAHYIYGLFSKLEELEARNEALEKKVKATEIEAEYWRLRAVANAENIAKINQTKGVFIDERV